MIIIQCISYQTQSITEKNKRSSRELFPKQTVSSELRRLR